MLACQIGSVIVRSFILALSVFIIAIVLFA